MCEMSWKSKFIEGHGEETYEVRLTRRRNWGAQLQGGEAQRSRERREAEPERYKGYVRAWRKRNPNKVIEQGRQVSRKSGKYYKKKQIYKSTGLQGGREKIRARDNGRWRKYKRFVAPGSQLHHAWCINSENYTGLALVEADAHMHGFINVIKIIEGEIRLFTEKELRERSR